MNIDMTPEMRSRLESASINGCPIAKRVMEIIDRDIPVPDMLKGSWSTVRITNRGEFKYIRLDNHAENGDITRTSPYQFVEDVLKSVNDPLAACIAGATPRVQLDFIGRFTSYFEYGHEVFVKVLSSYEDIRKAFLGESWGTFPASRGDNLWPKYLNEKYAERVAKFYTQVVPAKVLVAYDEENHIQARAVVFENAIYSVDFKMPIMGKFMDLLYSINSAGKYKLEAYAAEMGVCPHATSNAYGTVLDVDFFQFPDSWKVDQDTIREDMWCVSVPMRTDAFDEAGIPVASLFDSVCDDAYGNMYIVAASSDGWREHYRMLLRVTSDEEVVETVSSCANCGTPFVSNVCPKCGETYIVDTVFGKFGVNRDTVYLEPYGEVDKCAVENGDLKPHAKNPYLARKLAINSQY